MAACLGTIVLEHGPLLIARFVIGPGLENQHTSGYLSQRAALLSLRIVKTPSYDQLRARHARSFSPSPIGTLAAALSFSFSLSLGSILHNLRALLSARQCSRLSSLLCQKSSRYFYLIYLSTTPCATSATDVFLLYVTMRCQLSIVLFKRNFNPIENPKFFANNERFFLATDNHISRLTCTSHSVFFCSTFDER